MVTDAAGSPLGNVAVYGSATSSADYPTASTKSDADGKYTLKVFPNTIYTFTSLDTSLYRQSVGTDSIDLNIASGKYKVVINYPLEPDAYSTTHGSYWYSRDPNESKIYKPLDNGIFLLSTGHYSLQREGYLIKKADGSHYRILADVDISSDNVVLTPTLESIDFTVTLDVPVNVPVNVVLPKSHAQYTYYAFVKFTAPKTGDYMLTSDSKSTKLSLEQGETYYDIYSSTYSLEKTIPVTVTEYSDDK